MPPRQVQLSFVVLWLPSVPLVPLVLSVVLVLVMHGYIVLVRPVGIVGIRRAQSAVVNEAAFSYAVSSVEPLRAMPRLDLHISR